MAEPNVEELVKKRDVAGLIKALKYDPIDKLFSEHIRRKAAEALGGLGDQRAIRPLCRRFGDHAVRGVVREAIQAILNQLTEEDRRKMARRLIEAFRSMDDKDEQRGLAMALAVIGKPAAEPLFRLTEHYSKDIRENAALALGEMGDTRAIRPLMRVVDDKYSLNRGPAATLLGSIGDTKAVKTLGRAMRSGTTDYSTGVDIAEALEKMGTSGLEVLTQALHSRHETAPFSAAEVLIKVERQQRIPMTDRDRRKFDELKIYFELIHRKESEEQT